MFVLVFDGGAVLIGALLSLIGGGGFFLSFGGSLLKFSLGRLGSKIYAFSLYFTAI